MINSELRNSRRQETKRKGTGRKEGGKEEKDSQKISFYRYKPTENFAGLKVHSGICSSFPSRTAVEKVKNF